MELNDPLSIRQLEVFVALVDQGSFTKAARNIGLSQSTVSGHVADLERRLGATLFERERGGVRLTAAATTLLPLAREVLRAEGAARQAVRDLSGLAGGQLLVGGSTIPATYLLPGLFGQFHRLHPGISLRLRAGDSREILDCILGAEIELGAVGLEPTEREFDSVVLGEDRLLLVSAPDHPVAALGNLTVDGLRAFGIVSREAGSGTRAAALRALGRGEPLRDACEMGSTEAVRAAIRAGIGPGFISEMAVADDLAAGRLVEIPLQGFASSRRFYLASRKGSVLSPAARAFLRMAHESQADPQHDD
jgi:molybdate transport repressor ModE-like protein